MERMSKRWRDGEKERDQRGEGSRMFSAKQPSLHSWPPNDLTQWKTGMWRLMAFQEEEEMEEE